MRPDILNPIFRPLTAIPGVGLRLAKLIEKLAGPRLVNVLWHFPCGLVDRSYSPKIAAAIPGKISTITVKVDAHYPSHNKRQPYKIMCSDETGSLILVFFRARKTYLTSILPVGEVRTVSGKTEIFNNQLQITHPDYIVKNDDLENILPKEPVYPMTTGLSLKVFGKAMRKVLEAAPDFSEWLDPEFQKSQRWLSWKSSITSIHNPKTESDFSNENLCRQRIAYDELLANQLALSLTRSNARKVKGRSISGNGNLRKRIIDNLPYSFTTSQKKSIIEIEKDMAAPHRMLRLLQGDVGSGKTIVALVAILNAIELGIQAVLMAPTSILAKQHFDTIQALTQSLGVNSALLTSREKGKAREVILKNLAENNINLLIGTHALFQESVEFHDLAIVVIDEQHRFGVDQRLALTAKGESCDILVMTATPIPRTLVLTSYGDLDVSRLTEKPADRKPIITGLVSINRYNEVIERIRVALTTKDQIYWVCPLIEDSESMDLAAAEDRYSQLQNLFGNRVGLIHGRMKKTEKNTTISKFFNRSIDILVATTVIEVGVDIPSATIMIVEHAERFGLSQLHQLRGRVGRSSKQSSCVLMYQGPLNNIARQRLEVMRNTQDGFIIAEKDLKLRGAGELLGTRQSGVPEFRIADITTDEDLLKIAHADAAMIIKTDPKLQSERGKALKTLLYLFERDAAIQNLNSG